MNKPLKNARLTNFTLGDLVVAISSSSRTSREATLAIMDLLESRRVLLVGGPAQRNRH